MSRIAFFSIPAHGHTNPTVEVVRTLAARGHRVRYYSFEEFRARLEGAGAEFVPCDSYLPPAPRDVEQRIGRDFASLIGMVVDVTAAMEERVLGELAAFQPHCIVADSLCIWGKLYAERLGVPLVCSTTTFAFDQETAKGMRPGPAELLRTLAGMPRIGKKLALLRANGYRAEKLTDLIQNDSATDTIVYTSRAFQPGGGRFGERVAFVGPVLPELPAPAERGNRPLIYVSLGTVMNRNARFYRNCAEALGGGPLTQFERLCDNALTAYLSQARRVPFGEHPLIGYLYAKENELTAIRVILTGRLAGLDTETIRERLREAYV